MEIIRNANGFRKNIYEVHETMKEKNSDNSKKNKKGRVKTEGGPNMIRAEAYQTFSDPFDPLGSYTGTPSVTQPKSGKNYVRTPGVIPLVDQTSGSSTDTMMPPVLPPALNDAGELIPDFNDEYRPTQDADDL